MTMNRTFASSIAAAVLVLATGASAQSFSTGTTTGVSSYLGTTTGVNEYSNHLQSQGETSSSVTICVGQTCPTTVPGRIISEKACGTDEELENVGGFYVPPWDTIEETEVYKIEHRSVSVTFAVDPDQMTHTIEQRRVTLHGEPYSCVETFSIR